MDLYEQEAFEAYFVSQMPPSPFENLEARNLYGDFASVEGLLRTMYDNIMTAMPEYYMTEARDCFPEDAFVWLGGQLFYERVEEVRREVGLYDNQYSLGSLPSQIPAPLAPLLASIGHYNDTLGTEIVPAHGVNEEDGSCGDLPKDVARPPKTSPSIRACIDFKKLRDRLAADDPSEHVDGLGDVTWTTTSMTIPLDGGRRGQRILASRALISRYIKWTSLIRRVIPLRPLPRGGLRQQAWAQSVIVKTHGLEMYTEPNVSQLDRVRAFILIFARHEWAQNLIPSIKGRNLTILRKEGATQLRSEYVNRSLSDA